MNYSIEELIKITGGTLHTTIDITDIYIEDFEINAVNSTEETRNCAFININPVSWGFSKKHSMNWSSYYNSLFKNYKRFELIITETNLEDIPRDIPQLVVGNTYQALKKIAKISRLRFDGNVIAITGSVGKSTTRKMFEHLLEQNHNVIATRGNHNTQSGVPLYTAKLIKNASYGVIEISLNALNNKGNQSKLVKPNVAIVTTIGEAHMSTISSLNEIAKFKGRIFQGLEREGLAIINHDIDEGFEVLRDEAYKRTSKVRTYSLSNPRADLYMKNYESVSEGSKVLFVYQNQSYEILLSIRGEGMAANALAVCLCLLELGLPIEEYLHKFANFKSLEKILDRKIYKTEDNRRITILDDSHNAAIPSMINGIQSFKEEAAYYKGKKILVLGQVADLGDQGQLLHLRLLHYIESSGADVVFGHGELMREVIKCLPNKKVGGWFDNAQDLAMHVPIHCSDDSIVLLKGSVTGSDFRATSTLLPREISRSKEIWNGLSTSLYEVLKQEAVVYKFSKKELSYELKVKDRNRVPEGLGWLGLLINVLQETESLPEESKLQNWSTNVGESIKGVKFTAGNSFSTQELISELLVTQHPSAIYQLAYLWKKEIRKSYEVVKDTLKSKGIPDRTVHNLTGRYRTKEQQSYGISELYKISSELIKFEDRLPNQINSSKGIVFGNVRKSAIIFAEENVILALGYQDITKLENEVKYFIEKSKDII